MATAGGFRWLLTVLVLGACSQPREAPAERPASATAVASASPWQILPGRSAGPVTPASSEADLKQQLGPTAVRSTRIELGEGETTPGAVLFPDDSLRRAEIIWHDTVSRSRPARLILRGSRSEWKVGQGISLGTSLRELERLNGRPFTLAGFVAGLSGLLNVWWNGQIDPASISIGPTLILLIIAVIGGVSYFEGAWVGAFVYVVIFTYLRDLPLVDQIGITEARFNTVIGIIVLLIMVLSPEGAAGIAERIRRRLGGRTRIASGTSTSGPRSTDPEKESEVHDEPNHATEGAGTVPGSGRGALGGGLRRLQ